MGALTVPTIEELETEVQITHQDSLKEIPHSQKTIELFKGYFDDVYGKKHTHDEVIKLMKADPNPNEHDKLKQARHNKEAKEKYIHSDLVLETAKSVGVEL